MTRVVGHPTKPRALPVDRIGLLTQDEPRYADELWWREARPEIAMGPGSWGWVASAFGSMRGLQRPGLLERVQQPVLILAADRDRLVDNRAIERAAQRLPHAELVRFGAGARHFPDIDALLAEIKNTLTADITVLVKGSRFMQMERVVKAIAVNEAVNATAKEGAHR